MLSLATLDDIPSILEICEDFYNESGYSETGPFNREYALEQAQELIQGDKTLGVIILAKDSEDCLGMISGLKSVLPFSGQEVSVELLWYVKPPYRKSLAGIRLLQAYEYWAREIAKVSVVQATSLQAMQPRKIGQIYQRLGYKKVENAFFKKLD